MEVELHAQKCGIKVRPRTHGVEGSRSHSEHANLYLSCSSRCDITKAEAVLDMKLRMANLWIP